ncbi:MAG: winged helix-turn-helix domain-containing protein, partial [Candidatus Thalassarchaeum sp.]|nr:winged helix-turn-helix domain-containing protein [Candidatus Thalassarchaeum sp.]
MSEESPDSAWKIRSKHRRRLLDRLTEGGATVSELARDADLRVPHASAEIKRLRTDGLVSSDLSAGSRGAKIHLTESGWESVRADE